MATKIIPLDTKTRILVGAIGGISPIIISLLVVDVVALYNSTGLMDGIGLGIRFFVLIFIGGLIGYLHQNEEEPFKLFQLGIAAPALLTTAINGNSVTGNQNLLQEHKAESTSGFFIKSAHAGQADYKNIKLFQKSKVSDTQLFLRGLIGTKLFSNEDDWYVIVGSHRNIKAAKAQVKSVRKKHYKAKVYSPVSSSKYYSVVIGANLDLKTAERLRKQAIKNGLPDDSYLWKRK